MKKNIKPNTDKDSLTKNTNDNYYDFFSFKQKPISKAGLMKLIQDGIEWARNEEKAYKVMTFFRSKGFCGDDIKRWCERDPEFKKGYVLMIGIIGDRREMGALEKRLSETIVLRSMHRYDEDWVSIDKHHALLRQKAEEQATNIHVHFDAAEETNVPKMQRTEIRNESRNKDKA